MKDQAKPFIDTFVDRAAGALASFLWLFLTWAFHVDRPDRIVWASLATLGVIAVWLGIIVSARRAYVAAYRKMLGAGEVDEEAAPALRRPAASERLRLRVLAELDKLGADETIRRGKRLRAIARLTRKAGELRLPPEAIAAPLSREADAVRRLSLALQAEAASVAASTTKPPLVSVLHARQHGGAVAHVRAVVAVVSARRRARGRAARS